MNESLVENNYIVYEEPSREKLKNLIYNALVKYYNALRTPRQKTVKRLFNKRDGMKNLKQVLLIK